MLWEAPTTGGLHPLDEWGWDVFTATQGDEDNPTASIGEENPRG